MPRPGVLLLAFAGALAAQAPPGTGAPPVLEFTGAPLAVPYICNNDDLQWAGLSCSEEACPIYLELSHAAGSGPVIVVTGNLHAESATLYSILLRSDDNGKTWREPLARIRGAELDAIQFFDAKTAWISGVHLQPLPHDPFFLLSTDGGAAWENLAMFEEGTPGVVQQFTFDTADHGTALVDRRSGAARYEVYESTSGGHAWTARERTEKLPKLAPTPDTGWRVRAEPKLFRLEHFEDGRWQPVVPFAVAAASCKEQ